MALKIAGAVVLVALLLAGVVVCSFVFGQDLRIENTPTGTLVDVQWLGEYQSNVRRIQLSDANRVVWELRAAGGRTFPFWYVELHEGVNKSLPENLKGAEVVVPTLDTFQLSSGVDYRVDVWTSKDFKVPRHVSATFTLNPRQGA